MKQYFAFQWHITDECDQRCKHCYIFSGDTCKKIDSISTSRAAIRSCTLIFGGFWNCSTNTAYLLPSSEIHST